MAESRLRSLAAEINKLADTYATSLQEQHIPEASFEADSPVNYAGLTADMFMTRQTLCDKLMDMWYLAQGPSESIYNYVHNVIPDAACLNVLNHFDFWTAVPVDGETTYAEIAKRVSLPEDVVTRVLQHAVTLRLFTESSRGRGVKHTSRSAALARQPGLRALVSSVLDVTGAPMMAMNVALEKYARGKKTGEVENKFSQSAFALFHGNRYANSWDFLENDGEGERKGWRQQKFVDFMLYTKEIFHLEDVVVNAYDWAAAGKATVVDVGGSAGHDAILLAQKFPDLKLVVEDMPKVRPIFEAQLPAELRDRVSFVEHDLYKPQPAGAEADIYMLKLILHDNPDEECANILRALTPVLRPGNRVIVIEYIGKVEEEEEKTEGDDKKGEEKEKEKDSLPLSIRQMGTSTDLRMMAIFNAKERPVGSYRHIFSAADERFEVVNVKADPLSFIAVIEAVWRG